MKNLFKALAAFQQEVPVIHKGTQGYGYSYADLPKIFEVINPLLQKHGLGFTQLISSKDNLNYIDTVLFHIESGDRIESSTLIPYCQLKGMNDYQSFGSGITYFRRYCLSTILGIVTDKDTDAAGEQVKIDIKKPKPKITNDRFLKAVEAIKVGKYELAELITTFDLDEEQLEICGKL